ncbi:hydrolase [Pseudoalteromonas sp. NBT06-2]|uniref:TatD family hydrolase n=1 Tax=Pseudoalteromonas sp. NBT06-2 TaxID=2025950 RepID=UPI000BA5EE4C|nr:TatD family hydrolase [Pseudoalteromonas sp. NBT06-2]PAJ74631.1 hydrolase [Pseudoalteromonas sp. NBT06-2]
MREYHFFDSHCHIDFAEFDESRNMLLQQALNSGIIKMLVPGVTLVQSKRILSSLESCIINSSSKIQDLIPKLYFAVGLHPYFFTEHKTHHIDELEQLCVLNRNKIVAIGECGIDSSIADTEKQKSLFIAHIALANKLELPLIVHHRQSHNLIEQAFKQIRPQFGGVIHAFSGSLQQAKSYIKMGFKIGVGGVITYQRANKTRATINQLPLESLLLETDAPSMPISGKQGEINTPIALIAIFEQLVSLRKENKDVISKQLYINSLDIFNLV